MDNKYEGLSDELNDMTPEQRIEKLGELLKDAKLEERARKYEKTLSDMKNLLLESDKAVSGLMSIY